jgi:hypothetical protein
MIISPAMFKIIVYLFAGSGFTIWRLTKAYKELHKHAVDQRAVVEYLIHVIEENEIELTEFDMIALKEITSELRQENRSP